MSALPQLRALHAPLPLTSLAPLAQPRHAAAAPMAHVEHDDAGTVPFQQKGSEGERCAPCSRCIASRRASSREHRGPRASGRVGPSKRMLSKLRADCRRRFAGAPTNEQLSSGLLFFGNRLCPFAHRAWLAMHEKGVADEVKRIRCASSRIFPAQAALAMLLAPLADLATLLADAARCSRRSLTPHASARSSRTSTSTSARTSRRGSRSASAHASVRCPASSTSAAASSSRRFAWSSSRSASLAAARRSCRSVRAPHRVAACSR